MPLREFHEALGSPRLTGRRVDDGGAVIDVAWKTGAWMQLTLRGDICQFDFLASRNSGRAPTGLVHAMMKKLPDVLLDNGIRFATMRPRSEEAKRRLLATGSKWEAVPGSPGLFYWDLLLWRYGDNG